MEAFIYHCNFGGCGVEVCGCVGKDAPISQVGMKREVSPIPVRFWSAIRNYSGRISDSLLLRINCKGILINKFLVRNDLKKIMLSQHSGNLEGGVRYFHNWMPKFYLPAQ